MGKKMLINAADPEEYRVAILENGILEDLDIETTAKEQLKGNIYKGIVVKIEPSLQAAFVDFGVSKAGFLSFSEIQAACFDDGGEKSSYRRGRPRIQDVIKRGQELLVQIIRGERDTKGAALTTYISLPGRYLVLMPGSDSNGVSRRIEDEDERKKLKELIRQLNVPEGMGCIVRTAGLGRNKNELAKDLSYLLRLWNKILDEKQHCSAPSLIYQESDVVIRTIRDYFTSDITEVSIDNREVHAKAREFIKAVMPRYYRIVKLYRDKKPLFAKYRLEEQIEKIYERKVPLKSGGSIVIDPTEALVAIDVNSGRSVKEKSIEDTAFKTNREAAEEIARQLRLRDLGGLIVIDFIDMLDNKHMREVERYFRNATRNDKAKIQFSRISSFGMMELSRQRIKPSLTEGSQIFCLQCQGTGVIKSIKSFSFSIWRKLQNIVAKEELSAINVSLPLEAASYLLNNKREALTSLEREFDVKISILPNPQYLINQCTMEIQRKEKATISDTVSEKVKFTQDLSETAKASTPFTVPYRESVLQTTEYGKAGLQALEEDKQGEQNTEDLQLMGGDADDLSIMKAELHERTTDSPAPSPNFVMENYKKETGETSPREEQVGEQFIAGPSSAGTVGDTQGENERTSLSEWSSEYEEDNIPKGRSMSPYLILEALGEHFLEFIVDPSDKKPEDTSSSAGEERAQGVKETDGRTGQFYPDSQQSKAIELSSQEDKEKEAQTETPSAGAMEAQGQSQDQIANRDSRSEGEPIATESSSSPPPRKRRYYYRRRPRRSLKE